MRTPTYYIPHSGGPWPLLDMANDPGHVALTAFLQGLARDHADARAILMISAHWEKPVPTVFEPGETGLHYDYYNFPPHTYDIDWAPPADPDCTSAVMDALTAAGLTPVLTHKRGFDHGTFVPGMVAWPDAEIPVLQLSLLRGLDPAAHLALGQALAPLREAGFLIIGSGMSYHNLKHLFAKHPSVPEDSGTFDAWLRHLNTLSPAGRLDALTDWAEAPAARAAHPREEHLLPLHVVAGAALDDRAEVVFEGTLLGAKVSAICFG